MRFRLHLASFLLVSLAAPAALGGGLDFDQLASLRRVTEVRISPDGKLAAYTLEVPRSPDQDDGAAWSELHLVPTTAGAGRPYVHGEVNVSRIAFTPDGRSVTYLAKRDDNEHKALWAIAVAGGESRKLLSFKSDIENYAISPDGKTVALLAQEPLSKEREKAKKKGYSQEIFEEDWLPRKLWITAFNEDDRGESEPKPLEIDGSVFDLEWAPDGKRLAVTVAPRPLVDDSYMFRRVRIYDAASGELLAAIDNPGKLGRFAFSPDGAAIAMISAADANDPAEGRLMVAPATGGELRDLMPGLDGHITAFAWKDPETILAIADMRVETFLLEVRVKDGWKVGLAGGGGSSGNPVFLDLSVTPDGEGIVLEADSPTHWGEVFSFSMKNGKLRRLTDSNPWLADVELAKQEVVLWKARDGMELEGILIRPLDDRLGDPPPLILIAHGGPEAHYRNGWLTSYSRPGQLAAARGYAVFYANYRGGTGRGVAHSKLGQSDAAGREFDDLLDAVDHLAAEGTVDGERMGVTGGSYGGYATAWFATKHSGRFKAGVMFVGISNKLTKGFTTDVPYEDMMVHTRFDPWENWQFSLERSPLYYVEQARTPLLIAGGTSDSRVHPSQSLQLYRALKLIGKAPVRYVRYPGEGHGNRRAAAKNDYTRRLMRWMDHFVVEGATELPDWDLGLWVEEVAVE